ncbi:butyrophilin subfamily 2 member A1-like isoform 1-T1 [Odontesthes bonariensis]|uniref:butyrophilin subfamily 2 member A1-like isoform X2 n=1 Tax=Odontesthes bonariensis TaxID=219752 RepID=UPI003F587FBA
MAALRSASLSLLCVGLLLSASAEHRIITAEPGQDVTLTCRAPNNNPIIVVEWSRADLGKEYVLIYRDDQLDLEGQHPSYKNRVDLQDRQMKDGDVSLILKDVTTEDRGTYECRIFQEEINDGKISDPISIIHLAVVEPGKRTGGGEEEGNSREPVGLMIALSGFFTSLLPLAAVGFLIYRRRSARLNRYLPPAVESLKKETTENRGTDQERELKTSSTFILLGVIEPGPEERRKEERRKEERRKTFLD